MAARGKKRRGTPRKPPRGKPIQPGEVRNPTGKNGWSEARATVKALLAENGGDIVKVMQRLALAGDVRAAELVLKPLLPPAETKAQLDGELIVKFEDGSQ